MNIGIGRTYLTFRYPSDVPLSNDSIQPSLVDFVWSKYFVDFVWSKLVTFFISVDFELANWLLDLLTSNLFWPSRLTLSWLLFLLQTGSGLPIYSS